MAAFAGAQRPAFGESRAAAIVAGCKAGVRDGLGAAGGCLLERDGEADAHVTAARAGSSAAARGSAHAAEEAIENVVDAKAAAEEIGHVGVVSPAAEAHGPLGIAVAIVVGALALIGEHRVRLVDLLELLFGIGGVVDVGMERAGELQKRTLDSLLIGVARNAQNLVVIALRLQNGPPAYQRSP